MQTFLVQRGDRCSGKVWNVLVFSLLTASASKEGCVKMFVILQWKTDKMSRKQDRALASTVTSPYQIQRVVFHLLDVEVGCVKEQWEAAGLRREKKIRGREPSLCPRIKPAVVGMWENIQFFKK